MENIKKTKKFIFTSPFQKEGQLRKVIYQAEENSPLKYGETSFPIIPVINGYVEENEKILIVCVVTEHSKLSEEYPNAARNYERFKTELTELAQKKNLKFILMDPIITPYGENIKNHLNLYAKLITTVGDNEIIYADLTYGTKPFPIVEIMALNYAYKLRKNTDIGSIVYGDFDPVTNVSGINDISPLFFMDAISSTMAHLKLKDPAERIKDILAIDINDEDTDE